VWYMLAVFAAAGLLVSALPPAVCRAWRLTFGRRETLPGGRGWIHVPMVVAIAVAVVFPLSLLPRFH
jgi:hypothetical protein